MLECAHVESGEPVPAPLRRELREELGLTDVGVGDLIALTETRYTDARGEHHEINLVFDVSVRGVEPRSLEPHIEFRWAEQSELHGLEVRPVPIAQVVRTQFDGPRLPLLTEGFNEEELQE
ncbi:MAG TPA: NUDIX domain-containing protein [Nocardioidaceae bacterium]|jgi:8-oxo-dGTP pyrophosphatase MutT (NUDIX family)